MHDGRLLARFLQRVLQDLATSTVVGKIEQDLEKFSTKSYLILLDSEENSSSKHQPENMNFFFGGHQFLGRECELN